MVLLSGHYFQFREWIKGIMMNCKFLKIIGIGFILSVSTLANATLIDNGDYTTDTVSGLDWLDWTLTKNMTQAEALTQFSGAGWRIATGIEARGLLNDFFGTDFHGPQDYYDISFLPDLSVLFPQFIGLFGATSDTADTNYFGTYARIDGHSLFGAQNGTVYIPNTDFPYGYHPNNPLQYKSRRYEWMGVALVKAAAVSEPAIITIFALGFAGIGFARRRQ
jgi:hypothetical protein